MFFWYCVVLFKYTVFHGRSHRKEYWTFKLCDLMITLVLMVWSAMVPVFWVVFVFYRLALTIPSIAAAVRRFHDTGRSGWLLLMTFIPVAGTVAAIVFLAQDSQPGTNRYGPNPKGG